MRQAEWEYIQFTGPQRLDRELHTLEGIIKGIVTLQRNLMYISLEYLRFIGYYGLKSQKGGSPYVAGDSPN